jgi:transcriptional regulator with GAF, ATPase, and Fis domain/tetratricopeptide (TPR) repeat protein
MEEPVLTVNGNHSTDDDQRLLAVAALFKGEFSIDWLVDLLSEKKPSQIISQLEKSVAEGILAKKTPGSYIFKDLKRQEKYVHLLPEPEARMLHRYMADILMRQLPDDEKKAHAVAHHLVHIANDVERCRYLIKAGDLHRKTFQAEQALQCYRKVLDDLSCMNGAEEDRLFSETAIKYSKISTARHDTTKVLSILESALERAEKWDMKAHQALLKMHMAKNEWLRSRYTSALKFFEEGWSLAHDVRDPRLMLAATNFSTFFLFWQGRFQEAVRIYEKSLPDIERYPQGGFPLLAVITVGYCYAQTGQVTQGLGMLDALRAHGLDKGDVYLTAYAEGNIGVILLDIGRIDEAVQFLEGSAREAREAHNDWVWISVQISLAYAYYLKGEKKQAMSCLRGFLQQSRRVQATVYLYAYLLELCLAIKMGKLPSVEGLSLEKEIHAMIRGKNILLKGVAYRYEAILRQMEGETPERIIQSLEHSIRWLGESGSEIELAKSRLELARQHLFMGNQDKAKELTLIATKVLDVINETLVPDDLRALVKDRSLNENLLKEILTLGQEVVTIQDHRDLVQHILSTLNRITGAERGAIFLLEDEAQPPKLHLRASKNLTPEQIGHDGFSSSMKLIKEVAATGTGSILGLGTEINGESAAVSAIRSRICVPMILRGKTVGVLYHDNRMLSSAFRESDLELLSYFAALAAFALDNVKAYEEIRRLNRNLSEETLYYKEEHLQTLHFEDIVGESPAIKSVLAQIDQVTETDATVMIIGETGSGKELVARAIHRHSRRKDKPFIKVNCSALPESLIPSELFGHEKGAFTGATQRRLGRFELANCGTLFLDEIGEISQDIQVRLLRVLQNGEFERVGGSETLRSDFRLVVATNRNLEKDVKTQKFRADLYYRLAVFPIHVPPLRERTEDIPLLAYYFLKIYSQKRGKNFSKIPHSEMKKLLHYDWPGNVRELENIIERGTILNPGPLFRVPDLGSTQGDASADRGGTTLMENERRHILWALQQTNWKVRGKGGTAELLNIPPSTLAFRMNKLGIRRPRDPRQIGAEACI